MNPRPSLLACCFLLMPTLVMNAHHSAALPGVVNPVRGIEPAQHAPDCGGEPCDAVARGLRAFFDRRLHGLGANGRSCADCHMATDHFQLSPANAEARFRFLQLRRRWDPNADDPLFRPIDADDFRTNGENASDFSNLRKNGLVRIVFTLPPNIKLVDPITNAPSSETFVDVWRAVPTVNDVKLTGNDAENPWPRGPNAARVERGLLAASTAKVIHREDDGCPRPGRECQNDLRPPSSTKTGAVLAGRRLCAADGVCRSGRARGSARLSPVAWNEPRRCGQRVR
jgi:hypothetical protein